MARADTRRLTRFEPIYDADPRTGASIEVFYADRALAMSFESLRAGFFHWSCKPGSLPDAPTGPFATSYSAYRDALGTRVEPISDTRRSFGKRMAAIGVVKDGPAR
jgi:hypothetical protein